MCVVCLFVLECSFFSVSVQVCHDVLRKIKKNAVVTKKKKSQMKTVTASGKEIKLNTKTEN